MPNANIITWVMEDIIALIRFSPFVGIIRFFEKNQLSA